MIRDGGLKPDIKVIDAATHRRYQASKGMGFDGMWPETNGGHNEESWFLNLFHPGGKFTISSEPIPQISDMTLAIRKETDKNKRNTMLKDLQKKLAVDMPAILLPGYSLGYTLNQPWLKNLQRLRQPRPQPELVLGPHLHRVLVRREPEEVAAASTPRPEGRGYARTGEAPAFRPGFHSDNATEGVSKCPYASRPPALQTHASPRSSRDS